MNHRLAVVIVTYNAAAHLQACLASLQHALADIPHEICVVDNASTDTTRFLLLDFPEIRTVLNPQNLGFATAANQGMKNTTAPYILWMNPDASFTEGDLSVLLNHMDGNPNTGILGLKILNPDKSTQLSCRSFPSYETALFSRYSLLTRLFPKNRFSQKYLKLNWSHDSLSQVDWVSGACLLLRREMIQDIGPLDENYFMYCEDVDLCKRAWNGGWKVLYHPGATVIHHIAGSSRQMPQRMIVEHHRSMWHYYKKHYRRNPLKDAVVAAAIHTRCFVKIVFSHLRPAA